MLKAGDEHRPVSCHIISQRIVGGLNRKAKEGRFDLSHGDLVQALFWELLANGLQNDGVLMRN